MYVCMYEKYTKRINIYIINDRNKALRYVINT